MKRRWQAEERLLPSGGQPDCNSSPHQPTSKLVRNFSVLLFTRILTLLRTLLFTLLLTLLLTTLPTIPQPRKPRLVRPKPKPIIPSPLPQPTQSPRLASGESGGLLVSLAERRVGGIELQRNTQQLLRLRPSLEAHQRAGGAQVGLRPARGEADANLGVGQRCF